MGAGGEDSRWSKFSSPEGGEDVSKLGINEPGNGWEATDDSREKP
jgi:hypothetical protein